MKVKALITPLIFLFFCSVISCEETLLEEDISDQQVQLLAPTNGSVVTSENVSFNWEEIEQASSYQLQVASPSFENAAQISLDTTVSVLQFTERLISGDYQWRIRAKNSGHQTPYSTANFSVAE